MFARLTNCFAIGKDPVTICNYVLRPQAYGNPAEPSSAIETEGHYGVIRLEPVFMDKGTQESQHVRCPAEAIGKLLPGPSSRLLPSRRAICYPKMTFTTMTIELIAISGTARNRITSQRIIYTLVRAYLSHTTERICSSWSTSQ